MLGEVDSDVEPEDLEETLRAAAGRLERLADEVAVQPKR